MSEDLLDRELREALTSMTQGLFADERVVQRALASPAGHHHRRPVLAAAGVVAVVVAIVSALLVVHSDKRSEEPAIRPAEIPFKGSVFWTGMAFAPDGRTGYAFGQLPHCRQLVPVNKQCYTTELVERVTHDGGRRWTDVQVSTQGSGVVFTPLGSVSYVATSPTTVYAEAGGRVTVSTDGGRTWAGVPTSADGGFGQDLVAAKDHAFLDTHGFGQITPGCGPGVQRFDGDTSVTVAQPVPEAGIYTQLRAGVDGSLWDAVDPSTCASHSPTTSITVHRSTDLASSWQQVTTPPGNLTPGGMVAYDAQHVWVTDGCSYCERPPHTDGKPV